MLQFRDRMSSIFIGILINFPITAHFYRQFFGKSIHYRGSHTVKTTRYFVHITVEFSTSVKNGVHHPHGRDFLGRMKIHRHTAAVIFYHDTTVFFQCQVQFCTKAGQMLVNSIVQDFPYHMVESSGASTSYIHTGTLANRFQPFQNYNITTIITAHILKPHLPIHKSSASYLLLHAGIQNRA